MRSKGISSLGTLIALIGVITLILATIPYFTMQYEANAAAENYQQLINVLQYRCMHQEAANESTIMPLCVMDNGTIIMMSQTPPQPMKN
jgi:hypothetical protein